MKVSDYVVRFVAALGVKHVFLVTGGGAMHLNDSLARCRELKFICNHHEQASAIAMEGYAKATNNIGVAMVTTGPGGTNAITGLAGAWLDSTPCLFLSGQVKRADRMFKVDGSSLGVRQRGPQELDIISIVKPLTKYAVTVTDPLSIRYHLEKAVHLATTGRPGPVWIDIPLDVQASGIREDELSVFSPEEPKSVSVGSSELGAQVHRLIAEFNRAKRPLILVGNGVRLAKAEKEFRELAAVLDAPVATTWLSMDLFGDEQPLCVGRPGTLAPRGANFALQNSDFLLTIGARMDVAVAGWSKEELARGAYKAMVDVDASELEKLSDAVQQPICADAGDFLQEMLSQRRSIIASDRTAWQMRCREWKNRYPLVQEKHRLQGPVSIYHLAEAISQTITAGDNIVSGSSGVGIEIFICAWPSKTGQRLIHTAGLGAMGFGIASSIGICLSNGGGRTICVDGDGGFMLNIQELATVSYLQLPIKFFVLNNGGYAAIRGSQKNFFGAHNIGCDPETGLWLPDVLQVARSYNLGTAEIHDQAGLDGQIKNVLEMPGPVVCDVKVIADEPREPRVTSVQRPDGSFISKPLEDLWPFLDRDEFAQNMIVEPVGK
ncbi:MAG TPA: thiamine pyrophosphate-binding protein [Terriglobales bacterium]|nr:thiamine pyrophosphate-binding protein [Terriglobales bacterium]